MEWLRQWRELGSGAAGNVCFSRILSFEPLEDQSCLPRWGQGWLSRRVRLRHPLRVTGTHTLPPPVGFCGFFRDTQALRKRPLGASMGPCSCSTALHLGPAGDSRLPGARPSRPSSASGLGASAQDFHTAETQAKLSRWLP